MVKNTHTSSQQMKTTLRQ